MFVVRSICRNYTPGVLIGWFKLGTTIQVNVNNRKYQILITITIIMYSLITWQK